MGIYRDRIKLKSEDRRFKAENYGFPDCQWVVPGAGISSEQQNSFGRATSRLQNFWLDVVNKLILVYVLEEARTTSRGNSDIPSVVGCWQYSQHSFSQEDYG